MDVVDFEIPGLLKLTPRRFADSRGYFTESFRSDAFEKAAGHWRFVQDNHSYSARAGTVRALHFQRPPRAQGKLVRVVRGAVLDIAVDIRRGSPTYGRHAAVELSADNGAQLWIPPGFLHGFCTLGPDTDLVYKVTDYYSAEHDAGVYWRDPDLNVPWPVSISDAILSDKDQKAPQLRDYGEMFVFGQI